MPKRLAKQIFDRLQRTPERGSVLTALGRLGKSTLKQRVPAELNR
jgi:hypothetical protein